MSTSTTTSSKLSKDVADLAAAEAQETTLIQQVASVLVNQNDAITNLQKQLADLQAGGTEDLSGLETAISQVVANNTALQNLAPQPAPPTPTI